MPFSRYTAPPERRKYAAEQPSGEVQFAANAVTTIQRLLCQKIYVIVIIYIKKKKKTITFRAYFGRSGWRAMQE